MGRLISDLISPQYQALLRELHAQRIWGDGGYKYADDVRRIASDLNASTVLDYGCGVGTLKTSVPELDVREYDPGIIGKDHLPAPADLVVCSDVVEHIEPHLVSAVIDHIGDLTEKACFMVISTRLAHTMLPDGNNAHLTVQTVKWWLEQLRNRKDWLVNLVDRSEDHLIAVLLK